ncbi:MAG: UbiD family decarboxylase [Chloroflexi bacterium]|nr:UbiD family decarboxylase [Chloroflexota bacterium]
MSYPDLREHLRHLEAAGLLYRIKQPINKDTEMHPLVRWQYRGGIPEDERKAFLFERVVDVQGRRYPFPVVVGALAASPQVYAIGLNCEVAEVPRRWERALKQQISPVLVEDGPVHEVVLVGEALEQAGGVGLLPVPISTPGFDNAPYLSAAHWVSKSPATGQRNVGHYRGQLKAPLRLGMFVSNTAKHIRGHWEEARQRGEPLPAAVVLGCTPAVSYAAVMKVPPGVDELAVAGGLLGEPIQVVRCQTVPLEVPAEAEFVIEGLVRTDVLEPEGPFGESHGYIHPRSMSAFLEVTAITHRRDAIFPSIISQVTPSESSVIKKVGYDTMYLVHLRDTVGLKMVTRVFMHEPLTNLRKFVVVQMRQPTEPDVWRALMAAAVLDPEVGKIMVAVDEDIDPQNLDAVLWAMCYRTQPHRDMQIISGRSKGHSPPFRDETRQPFVQPRGEDSALLINATLKEPFPPVALPKREYMERARELWEELGLPPLHPEAPWYGYTLGDWSAELDEEADLAVRGEHYQVGEKQARQRRRLDDMQNAGPEAPTGV